MEIFCAGDNPRKNIPLSSPLKNSTKNLKTEYSIIYKTKTYPSLCDFFRKLCNIKNILKLPKASYNCVGCLCAIAKNENNYIKE